MTSKLYLYIVCLKLRFKSFKRPFYGNKVYLCFRSFSYIKKGKPNN